MWGEDVVHIADCEIVPVATYEIQATLDDIIFSDPLELPTIARPGIKYWGDVTGEWDGIRWKGPNGTVNMDDIQVAVRYFQGQPNKPQRHWVDVDPEVPDRVVNMADVFMLVQAFRSAEYPFSGPDACP